MTGPAGVVDLSLPDYPTLIAQAGVDPDAEAARVGSAVPADVHGMGAAFGRAGGEMDAAWQSSMGAQGAIGAAFTNNGVPVLDRATHVANLPAGFGDAGARLAAVSGRLVAVGDELSSTMRSTSTAVSGLHGELQGMRSQWAARVAAAATAPGGLIPEAAVPGLLAERDRIATDMATRVGAVGRQVTDRIHGYEVVINDTVRLLADQGFVDPADLDAPPPAAPVPPAGPDPTGFGTPLMAGYAADPVNTALGNFVEVEHDLPFGGQLAGLTFARTYNSRSDRVGPFGARWSCWATTRLVDRTWTAEFEGPDGQRVSFPRSGSGFGRAVGISALVERVPGGLSLAWFDGRRWEFDAAGRLSRTWAGPGTGVRFEYDEAGRLSELVHDRGRRVMVDWDPAGARIVAVTGSDGRRVGYRYDEAGALVEADGPAGPRHYGIDEVGLVASVTDADGVVELVNTYDHDGRVVTQRSPFGRVTTFRYGPDDQTVVADDSAGPTNTYRHDRAGRLIAATDGHGHTLRKRYDAWGNPVEIVERGGAVTRQEFDHRAHLVRRALPSGAVYAIEWDDVDRLTAITATGAETAPAVTRFEYVGAERTASTIIDPEGGVTRLHVVGGVVGAITDPDGVTVRLRHDSDGNLVEAVDAAGGVARIERDPAGWVSAVVTPAGRRTELVHDAHGRLVSRRDPGGAVWRYEYSAAGRQTAVTDPTGARTETRYGPHGEAGELIDAVGAVTGRRLDVFGNLADSTAPGGAKWAYSYDALSRLAAWTDPGGGSWLAEYDADGNRTAAIDPTGVRTSHTYDAAGRLTGTDDGLVTSTYTYDELGRPTAGTRAGTPMFGATYDRCGRRLTETAPDGGRTHFQHTPAGRLLRIVSPAGRETNLAYDQCGRLSTRIDGNDQHWAYRYDRDGLLIERSSPAGLVETITRDVAGRVTRHRIPGRGHTSYEFDPAGRVVAIADRAGARRFTRDAAGRITAATDALGHTTHYTWDDRGNLTTVTDPLGARTGAEHDELGRLTAVTDPLGRTTRFGYDAAGRLLERIEPAGGKRRWSYDDSGRLARISAGRATIGIDRDELGRAVRIAESGSPADAEPVELAWDRAGRLVERRVGDRAVGWSYDPDGLRTGLTHPDGSRTGYRRDAAGRVSALSHPLLGRIELTRDPDGRLLSMSGAGAGARWTYDDGWLSEHRATADGRQRTTRLRRDEHGRVQIEQTDGRSRRLHYDAAGQLDRADDAEGRRSYRYDPAGRLSAETGPQGPRGYSYDPAGQLLSSRGPDGERRYRYDDVGRRVAEHGEQDSRSYDWDGFGRLRAVHTATADGTRSSVALQTDTVGELTEAGDVGLAWDSAAGSAPLVAIGEHAVVGYGHPWALADAADGSPRYLHPDWQGTVAGGDHDPWGSTPGGIGLGYRGELAVDGLIWLRNRAYDPATRGFLQVDPWPAVPGTAVAGHPYHYAGNDPINNVDPLGRRPVTDADLAAQRDEDGGGGWLSDLGHGVLDVVGLVPGVGEVADLANAAWYTAEGDYVLAGLSAAAAIPFAGWLATGGKAAVKGARAAEKLSPHAIRFSQSSVNGAAAIEASMRADGWVGDAIDVVRMSDGGLTSVDNTRLLAAKRSDIDVDAHVHALDDALPAEFAERFVSRKGDVPTNWGEAVTNRIDSQNAGFRNAHPQGSPITGWSGN